MKLFIWNTEHKFLMAVAENVETAKDLILKKSFENRAVMEKLKVECKIARNQNRHLSRSEINNLPEVKAYYDFISKSDMCFEEHDNEFADTINQEPDFVFDVDSESTVIYRHSNEGIRIHE